MKIKSRMCDPDRLLVGSSLAMNEPLHKHNHTNLDERVAKEQQRAFGILY